MEEAGVCEWSGLGEDVSCFCFFSLGCGGVGFLADGVGRAGFLDATERVGSRLYVFEPGTESDLV